MLQGATAQRKKKYNSYATQAVATICQLKQQKDEFYETKAREWTASLVFMRKP